MKHASKRLIVKQLDKKLIEFLPLSKQSFIPKGWIALIRKTLNMSLRQLGNRLSVSPQGVKDIEKREAEGSITLNTLREVGNALDMTLVYGFVPKNGSLEKMIENRAKELAQKIVMRTSTTMKLEDQENSDQGIKEAIDDMTEELKREMPKSLWD